AKTGGTPTPMISKLLAKRDRRIIVRREDYRDPVPVDRLVELRDTVNAAINNAHKGPNPPKIAAVTVNSKNNYILSTLGNTPASEVLKYKANLEAALRKLDKAVLTHEGDQKWYSLIVHGVRTSKYDDSIAAMAQLRTEIESFNTGITLVNNPCWLKRPEARADKKSSSVSILVRSQEVADACLKRGLNIDMQKLEVVRFVQNKPDQQCSKCKQFGHHYLRCTAKTAICRLCDAGHATTDHNCTTCKKCGFPCGHLTPYYANCRENGHSASDNTCPVRKVALAKRQQLLRKPQSSNQRQLLPIPNQLYQPQQTQT